MCFYVVVVVVVFCRQFKINSHASGMDTSVEEATVASKCSSRNRWPTLKAIVGRVLNKQLQCLKEHIFISRTPSKAGESRIRKLQNVGRSVGRSISNYNHSEISVPLVSIYKIFDCIVNVIRNTIRQ